MDKEIKDLGTTLRDTAEDNWQEIHKEYWRLHKKLTTESFPSRWEQMKAVRKLSQLGLALHASGEALSALNSVRCI